MRALLASVASYPTQTIRSVTTLTVPAAKVASSIPRFPLKINLAHMPTSFWRSVAVDGGNVRVTTSADVLVPVDIVRIDKINRTGEAFALVSLSSTASNVFKVKTAPGLNALPKNDVNGQYAVWSDYRAMYIMDSNIDRTGINGALLIDGDTIDYNYVYTTISPKVDCHQGIAYDGTFYYTIHTDVIQKRSASWGIVATLSLSAIGIIGVNHFGDGCIWNGMLVLPVEQYTNYPYNNQHLVYVNTSTMTVAYTRNISANLHEISGVCYHPAQNRFYVTDFTPAGYSLLHMYTTDGAYLGVFNHAGSLPMKQAISYYNGKFFITGGPGTAPTINSVDAVTGAVTLEWTGGPGAAIEGLECLVNGNLLVLFDGNAISNVYTFVLRTAARVPGWLNLDGRGNGRINGIGRNNTAWTMGASFIPKEFASRNGGLMSWSEATVDNATRATLVARLGGRYGMWNSDNTWINADAPAVGVEVGVRARVHHTQSGTSNRKVYVNGVLGGSQNTVAQRPSTLATTIFVGAEDLSFDERARGALNYFYVRNGEASAAMIKAEYDSWETDNFYSITTNP